MAATHRMRAVRVGSGADDLISSFPSFLCHAILRPPTGPLHHDPRPQPQNFRRRVHGRHAAGLRRHARVSRARGAAQDLRGDGEPHRDQAAARARREVRRLHGGRLRARHRQARRLHGAGDRRAQPRRRPARRLARAFAGDRLHRRPRAEEQVPQGLPGGRRRAGVRAGDQVQRHGGRRGALSRHGAPGVPRRDLGHARAGAPAVPRQRGPGRRRGGGDGAALRAAVRAGAAVPPGAGSGQRAGGAEDFAGARSGR